MAQDDISCIYWIMKMFFFGVLNRKGTKWRISEGEKGRLTEIALPERIPYPVKWERELWNAIEVPFSMVLCTTHPETLADIGTF